MVCLTRQTAEKMCDAKEHIPLAMNVSTDDVLKEFTDRQAEGLLLSTLCALDRFEELFKAAWLAKCRCCDLNND